MTATHPNQRDLNEFLLGKLPDSEHAFLESHLSDCDSCRDVAAASSACDTLTELLACARTRIDLARSRAPTPTLDGAATPPAFAPTQAWGDADGIREAEAPAVLAQHPKYRVIRLLGVGGMGSVWLAEHTVMNREVAVKVIRPDLLARPGATGRFLREVRAAAKLHHPNIVTAFDAEPAGDSCLLVMEYVPGETLADRVQRGPLPIAEACRAIRDAARGLAVAHKAGLVHRDVKPHNLMRSTDGTTKVLDFGLAGVGAGEVVASTGDGLTGAGMVVGTPAYIAPEQIADPHAADARADIYGLGCTLYHLLSGRPPVPEGSVAETLAFQQNREPDAIPDLPAELARALAKMLAKRPEDRYESADEVVAALEPFIGDVRPAKRHWWNCNNNRWSIAASLLFSLVVLAGTVVYKIQRDKANGEKEEITITTNDPNIELVMKKNGELVRIRDPKSGQTWELNTLTNEIGLADSPDGLKLQLPGKEPFVLRRKGRDVFTVMRTPNSTPGTASADANTVTPRLARTILTAAQVENLAYVPDGKTLLVASLGQFQAYDPASGKTLISDDLHFGPVSMPLAVSADGHTAAVGLYVLFHSGFAAWRIPLGSRGGGLSVR